MFFFVRTIDDPKDRRELFDRLGRLDASPRTSAAWAYAAKTLCRPWMPNEPG